MSSAAITIDASQAAAGGQVVRASVALSAALGVSVRVTGIRSGLPESGLRPGHVAAVRAAGQMCEAAVAGLAVGSQELQFQPGALCGGRLELDAGGGAATLVLQTLMPAMILSDADWEVVVTGATHAMGAPCYEYLRDVYDVFASAAGARAYFAMVRPGFAPAGGGQVRMELRGLGRIESVAPIRLAGRGALKYIEGVCAASSALPDSMVDRQTTQVLARLAAGGHKATLEQPVWETDSPGTCVFLRAVCTRSVAGFTAVGGRGQSVDQTADQAVGQLLAFLEGPGEVDAHAADQLLMLAAVCYEESRFSTPCVTEHLQATAAVVERVAGRRVRIEGQTGQAGSVVVEAF